MLSYFYYRQLAQVPRSSREIADDREYILVSVVLFKRVVDEFKQNAKSRGFQVGHPAH